MIARRLLTITLLLVSRSAMADWPTWQHDNQRTGCTDEQIQTSKLGLSWIWQSSAPPQTAWYGPAKYDAYAYHRNLPSMRSYDQVFHVIAVGDHLWFGSSADDTLYCLNADDGNEHWSVTTDGPIRLAPTWADGQVYFGCDDGYARCVNATTGELTWKFTPADTNRRILNNGRFIPFQPCRTGVTVEDGTAWFACAMLPWKDAWLCSVDAKTGKADAPRHFVKSMHGRTMEGAPALSSKFVVLPQGRVAPRIFDRNTGKDLGEMVKSGGGSVVVVSLDESIFHGPATDSRKGGFRQSNSQTREMVAGLGRGNALVVDGGTSWMLTDSQIVASSLTERKVLWKSVCDCPCAMIKAGDTLFVGGDGKVAAYSAEDGQMLWTEQTNGRIFGLAASNGRLFASSDTGTIHCFAPNVSSKQNVPATAKKSATRMALENVKPIDDKRLIGHWAFQKSSVADKTVQALHGVDIKLATDPRFSSVGRFQAIELDGTQQTLMVSPEFRNTTVPSKNFTAEAWVRIDQLHEWGGIIGVIQDDGDVEHGWLLGYRKNHFCVAVASAKGGGKLTYLTADKEFDVGTWNHVAGTYDGDTIRLYVNGELAATSEAQSGEIDYPERAWFEIGAYHDKNEYFRISGGLHEVRLYDQSLSKQEISDHFESAQARFPRPGSEAAVASGPWLQFVDPETAIVRWTTEKKQKTYLEFGTGEFNRTVSDQTLRTEHEAKLTGLGRQRMYLYRIGVDDGTALQFTKAFECDTFFNYTPVASLRNSESGNAAAQTLLTRLVTEHPIQQGMCLVLGDHSAETLLQLCRHSQLRFVVVVTDEAQVEKLRTTLRADGVYGNQIAVHYVRDVSRLPFVGNWANLVLSTVATKPVIAEIERCLRPNGGTAWLTTAAETKLPKHFVRTQLSNEVAFRYTRPALPGAGDWSHLYGQPDNSAFSGENLGGAKSTNDLAVQWVGRPGPRYQADRSGRKPSPLSTNGRLFLQGLNRIVAVDAFNGTVLWSLEIPNLERFNMPRDCSNWCADQDHLYVVVKHECWKIDAITGTVAERFAATEGEPDSPLEWGYVATEDQHLYGTQVKSGASWTSFWGGGDAGWYDARSGAVTFPICSDRVFCRDSDTGELKWEYHRGIVMNSTITIGKDKMYFVESRDKAITEAPDRRIGDPKLWENLYLVAIDADSGSPLWEKKLEPMSQQVVMYLAHADKQLALVSSANTAYKVSSFNDENGELMWNQTTKWLNGKGDHGKAMSRPAIVGNRLFLRPNVLSMDDGKILPEVMPTQHGCGSYACTSEALFLRSGSVTMWDPENATTSAWPRLRPDCWISTIPAGGMLLSPEGGGGCSCGSWMETSLGFMPKVFDQRSE